MPPSPHRWITISSEVKLTEDRSLLALTASQYLLVYPVQNPDPDLQNRLQPGFKQILDQQDKRSRSIQMSLTISYFLLVFATLMTVTFVSDLGQGSAFKLIVGQLGIGFIAASMLRIAESWIWRHLAQPSLERRTAQRLTEHLVACGLDTSRSLFVGHQELELLRPGDEIFMKDMTVDAVDVSATLRDRHRSEQRNPNRPTYGQPGSIPE